MIRIVAFAAGRGLPFLLLLGANIWQVPVDGPAAIKKQPPPQVIGCFDLSFLGSVNERGRTLRYGSLCVLDLNPGGDSLMRQELGHVVWRIDLCQILLLTVLKKVLILTNKHLFF